MTENIPPTPPTPKPESYPSHDPSGAMPGNEPPFGPPQSYNQVPPAPYVQHPYAQPQYATYAQQPYAPPQSAAYPPQQYAAAGHWVPAGPAKPKSSGYRVASGIVGIVLGTWLIIPAIAGFGSASTAFIAFLILLPAFGNITAGIVLLANQRGRTQGLPITSLSFAGLALLFALVSMAAPYYGTAVLVSTLLLATPILIVMGIGLSREKRVA